MNYSSPDLSVLDEPNFRYPTQNPIVSGQAYELLENHLWFEGSASEVPPAVGQPASTQSYTPQPFAPSPVRYINQLHSAQSSSDTQRIPATSMDPPANPRKRKAPTLRAEAWEPYKARIIELHIERGKSLREVKEEMERETGFTAEYVSL